MRQRDLLAAISKLNDAELYSDVGSYSACQAIGAAAHTAGMAGLIALAATHLGETLALFTANVPEAAWPALARRDIWHGLPPDPRGDQESES